MTMRISQAYYTPEEYITLERKAIPDAEIVRTVEAPGPVGSVLRCTHPNAICIPTEPDFTRKPWILQNPCYWGPNFALWIQFFLDITSKILL